LKVKDNRKTNLVANKDQVKGKVEDVTGRIERQVFEGQTDGHDQLGCRSEIQATLKRSQGI